MGHAEPPFKPSPSKAVGSSRYPPAVKALSQPGLFVPPPSLRAEGRDFCGYFQPFFCVSSISSAVRSVIAIHSKSRSGVSRFPMMPHYLTPKQQLPSRYQIIPRTPQRLDESAPRTTTTKQGPSALSKMCFSPVPRQKLFEMCGPPDENLGAKGGKQNKTRLDQ